MLELTRLNQVTKTYVNSENLIKENTNYKEIVSTCKALHVETRELSYELNIT